MEITREQMERLMSAYNDNKEELNELEEFINENGITDDGISDVTISFEQGYNNAMEYVFSVLLEILAIDGNEELKNNLDYEFECNMSEEYKDMEINDEWGCAIIYFNDVGVEYNFCIDDGVNSCAIYKMKLDIENIESMECWKTDYDTFIHYEIDFNNKGWVQELENAMCKALIEFYDL